MSFELDPFQKEAIAWIEKDHSVLVCAPTGSGKTLIAERVIEKAMAQGQGVIYTAPVKALSNQKYRDFRARYGENTGILTGDVVINPDAPLLVMTAEIYRNCLFESHERIARTGWVIFDEVHYLDDPERGTVWEESLLFTPPQIKVIALSATVPNVHELASWMKSIHSRPIAVVEETHRPVPLEFLFQCQGRIIESSQKLLREGYGNRENWKQHNRQHHYRYAPLKAKPNRLDHLLQQLIAKDQLPAIYFAFGRRRTELLAWETLPFNFLNKEEHGKIQTLYQELLTKYDLLNERSAQEMGSLIERGIAFHHAGLLPTLKEVVEQLFTSRLIKLIFTTETFALGINMPARSVIFDELEKFYGTGFHPLTVRDFYQMAGRAGRRGMDTQGHVYTRINPHDIAYPEVQRILYGKPEPIRSQLNTAYATVLNLYQKHGRGLLKIYPQSFHHFQSSSRRRKEGYQLIERKIAILEDMGYLNSESLTPKGEFAASLFGYELILSEMQQAGVLNKLKEGKLCVLLCALIFEPRKGDHVPKLNPQNEEMRKLIEFYAKSVHRKEQKFRIFPYTKPPHFHLTTAVEAWVYGAPFEKLFRHTDSDEGELVRYFRMIIQLLRELAHAPHITEDLRTTALKAKEMMNRGVIDAERQLRA